MLGVPKLLPRQRVAFLNYRERKPANLRWLVFIDIRLLFRNVHTHLIGCALFSKPIWAQPLSDRAQRAENEDAFLFEIGQRERLPLVV